MFIVVVVDQCFLWPGKGIAGLGPEPGVCQCEPGLPAVRTGIRTRPLFPSHLARSLLPCPSRIPGALPKKSCAAWAFRELSRSVNFVGDVPLLIFLEVKELDL